MAWAMTFSTWNILTSIVCTVGCWHYNCLDRAMATAIFVTDLCWSTNCPREKDWLELHRCRWGEKFSKVFFFLSGGGEVVLEDVTWETLLLHSANIDLTTFLFVGNLFMMFSDEYRISNRMVYFLCQTSFHPHSMLKMKFIFARLYSISYKHTLTTCIPQPRPQMFFDVDCKYPFFLLCFSNNLIRKFIILLFYHSSKVHVNRTTQTWSL